MPNAVKVAMRYSQSGLEAYNILNVLCPAPATAANLVSIAGVFQSWWNTTLRPLTIGPANWLGADLTALDSPGSPFLAYNNSGITGGSNGSSTPPPQVTVAISLRTGLSGRSYRGRIYFIGISAADIGPTGLLQVSKATQLANAYNTLRTSLITAGFQLAVVSLYSGKDSAGRKIPRAVGIATPVTAVVCGLRCDTQRRRLPAEARA